SRRGGTIRYWANCHGPPSIVVLAAPCQLAQYGISAVAPVTAGYAINVPGGGTRPSGCIRPRGARIPIAPFAPCSRREGLIGVGLKRIGAQSSGPRSGSPEVTCVVYDRNTAYDERRSAGCL